MKVEKSWLKKIKVQKLGIKARVKQTVPKYTDGQEQRVQKCCKALYRKLSKKIVVMDDETYVPVDPANIPGRQFFHSVDPSKVDFSQKFKTKEKFYEKYIVWQAMDSNGNVSKPYIQKGTLDSQVYLNNCLKQKLIPFIDSFHNFDDVLFWPDLATSHYAKTVTEYLNSKNVDFVPKDMNPPNLPQCRPIETFWAQCKSEYKKIRKPSKNLLAFKRIWTRISNKVSKKSGKALMKGLKNKIKLVGENGIKTATEHGNI